MTVASLFADRVKEQTTTSGTGNITLNGAVAGFQSFNTAFGTGVSMEYCIEAVDASGVPTGDWEVGEGHLSASTTLVRDRVFASSNANALVSFAASVTKNVFCTLMATRRTTIGKALAYVSGAAGR